MLREIITPQSDEYILHIPKEYINTKVEILVLPFAYTNEKTIEKSKNKSKISLKGVFSSFPSVLGGNVYERTPISSMRYDGDRRNEGK